MADPGNRPENDRPMRIGLVTELYEPSVGGQQTRFRSLALGLHDLGAQVTVIATKHETGLVSEETIDGIRILRGPTVPRYMTPRFPQTVRSPIGMFRYAARCRHILQREKFDFVYFNQWPYLHILLAPRAVRAVAGIDWCETRDALIHAWPQRRLPTMVALNLSVNQWTGRDVGRRSGVDVGYLPSGVTLDRFNADAAPRRGLLFLGRLVANKNIPLLLDGFQRYCDLGGIHDLDIAGSGPEESELERRVRELPVDVRARVTLLGRVSEEAKITLLEHAALLVIPSLREGFPNVVAEAMAAGTPTVTVSSPENGTAHVVELYSNGTVGAPTIDGFAGAIVEALNSWGDFHANCVESSRQLDWSVICHDFLTTINGVIARRIP